MLADITIRSLFGYTTFLVVVAATVHVASISLTSTTVTIPLDRPCIAHSHQAYSSNANFKRWFDKGDDGDSGWSIYNREGQSKHRGVPIFNNAAAAVKGMKRLIARQENKPNPDWTRIHLAQDLLYTIKLRPVERANDEETLTFDADSRVGRSEWLQDEGDPWKQWDRDEGWHGHEQRHREDWNSRWRNQPEHGWNHQPRDENDPWEPGRPNDGHDGWDHQPRDENDPWKDWEPGRPNDGHDGWDHQLRDDHDPWRD